MDKSKALELDNIKKFVAAWYYALDIHAPASECHKFMLNEGLEMAFPEMTLHNHAEYDGWYKGIVSTFFDELHNVQSVEVTAQTDTTADLNVVVGWQASWFTPPAAKSKRTAMNAIQRWKVRTSDRNEYGLEITHYYVDRFDYAPGFAQL